LRCWSRNRVGFLDPCRERLRLAFQIQYEVLEIGCIHAGSPSHRVAHHQLSGPGSRTEAGHCVGCVPDDREVARSGLANHSDVRLPGVHSDTHR
jgi:hypothetical protein